MEFAAANKHDCILLPGSLKLLTKVSRVVGFSLTGLDFDLDSGFDSRANRKQIWDAGMKPNIPENPRNRDQSKLKRGRPRYFNHLSYGKRFGVERTFAWEDAYRSLVIRYDRKAQNFMGRKLLAYAPVNLRYFCGKSK